MLVNQDCLTFLALGIYRIWNFEVTGLSDSNSNILEVLNLSEFAMKYTLGLNFNLSKDLKILIISVVCPPLDLRMSFVMSV